jgi:hypothetical protein
MLEPVNCDLPLDTPTYENGYIHLSQEHLNLIQPQTWPFPICPSFWFPDALLTAPTTWSLITTPTSMKQEANPMGFIRPSLTHCIPPRQKCRPSVWSTCECGPGAQRTARTENTVYASQLWETLGYIHAASEYSHRMNHQHHAVTSS